MGPLVTLLFIGAATLTASRKSSSFKYATSCSECISASPKSVWCSGQMPPGELRCHLKSAMKSSGLCSDGDIVSPDEIHITVKKNKPLRPKRPISPQQIYLEMRKDATATISIEVLSKKKSVSVRFRYPRAVKIDVESNCTRFQWKGKTATCEGRGKMQLKVISKMKRCLPRPKKIKLTVDGNRKYTSKIYLKSRCTCDCEKNSRYNAPECMGHGNYSCGTCKCNRGFFGPRCGCHGSQLNDVYEARCKSSQNSTVCSGRGICVCGECECLFTPNGQRQYTGPFCECDDGLCEQHNGKKCGGIERGTCKCGQCVCKPDYKGPACQYSTSTNQCPLAESVPYSAKCNSHGTWGCGSCKCNPKYYGEFCECEESVHGSCKRNQNDTVLCSGRGKCVCGVCDCHKLSPRDLRTYSGQYCECDDWSCDYFNGIICGGPERGECRCGVCQCKKGYEGTACELSKATDKCTGFLSKPGVLCNNRGVCINNMCQCDTPYLGPTCTDCPTCRSMCSRLKQCVQCSVFNTGPYSQEVCHEKCQGRVQMVDALDRNNRHDKVCTFKDEDNCLFSFSYNTNERMMIRAQITKEC